MGLMDSPVYLLIVNLRPYKRCYSVFNVLFIVGGKGLPPYGPCYAVGRQPFADMDEQ